MVLRFPVVTETFVLRELNAVTDQGAFPVELFALRRGRGGALHPTASRWLPLVQIGSIARGCRELLRLAVRRPRAVARVFRDVLLDDPGNPRAVANGIGVVVLAASFAPAVRRRRVAHIHAHFATQPAEAARVLAALSGVTYSITAHAYDLFVSTHGLDRRLRGAQFVACISDYNRRFLRARNPHLECPLVHCGVPTAEMRRRPHAPDAESTRLIMVSGFQPKKGHAVLVEALRRSSALRSVRLDLVGTGPLERAIRGLVLRAGLEDRVTFYGDQAEDTVRRMVARSDILVQPSVVAPDGDMEGIPNSLIEAMALGIPVVTTSLSGIPELVIDGETGVVVRPGDPEALAAGLQTLMEDPDAAQRRAAAGLDKVRAEFDIADTGAAISALLDGVLKADSNGS